MVKFERAGEGQVFRLSRADDSHRLNIRAMMIHLAASSTTPRWSIPDSSSRMSILTRRMFRYDFLTRFRALLLVWRDRWPCIIVVLKIVILNAKVF